VVSLQQAVKQVLLHWRRGRTGSVPGDTWEHETPQTRQGAKPAQLLQKKI